MKVLELFAGTRSIGKAFEAKGHKVFSVDWDKRFPDIDWYADISKLTAADILKRFGRPDVIWASPDCATYSVLAIGHHRKIGENSERMLPRTDYAAFCDRLNVHLHKLIRGLKPKYWFIENPRGGMRKMPFMNGLPRYTVTYCQYGDSRMKPTDIWTNHPSPDFKPMCHNGDPCHESCRRHNHKGTVGQKNSVERSRIPDDLCKHIVDICERGTTAGHNAMKEAA